MLKRALTLSFLALSLGAASSISATAPAWAQASQKEGSVTTIIAQDNGNSDTVALLTRQQQRTAMLEDNVRDLRGIVEQDLRALKLQIEQMVSSASNDGSRMSGDIRALGNQMEQLADSIAMTNRRMERTLEITSDVEFRLLRLEKRMQTMMRMGGDDVAAAMVQQDTIAIGAADQVEMSRDSNDGSVTWSVDKDALEAQMGSDNNSDPAAAATVADGGEQGAALQPITDNQIDNQTDNGAGDASIVTETAVVDPVSTGTVEPVIAEEPAAPAQPEVLPDLGPEEQYMFAMNRAMQNDLETAELAFAEFRVFNTTHPREVDAAYWLGRVQFMRQKYEEAAMTFTQFNTDYPGDDRLTDTTLYIAESVSHFAPADQACAIYASLPSLFEEPSELFLRSLGKLSKAANCDAE